MKNRMPLSVWFLGSALLSVVVWLGCEQKGNVSPTGTNRQILTYIDTVIVNPSIMEPNAAAMVEARILTENNEPASGEQVRFRVNRGTLGQANAETTITTGNDGRAQANYTSPADTGSVLLRTELLSMAEMRTSSFAVRPTPQSIDGLLELWSNSDTLYADNGLSSTTVYARLRNSAHNPIGGAQILFSTNIGTITSPATTDYISGIATATLVSSNASGNANIVARYGTQLDTVMVSFLEPLPASEIIISSALTMMTAGSDSSVITARVFDMNSRPVVDNTLVLFTTSRGQLSEYSARTVGGMAMTTYYASPATGDVVVSASTGGSVNGNVTISITPGAVASIILASTEDTLIANNSSEVTVEAMVTDQYGNAVSAGTPVGFSTTSGTITISSTVGPNGRALAVYRVGLETGVSTIIATNNGTQGSYSIYLIPSQPNSIALSVNPLQLVANGSSQSLMSALVLDSQGRPVSNGSLVTFTSQFGQISESSAIKNPGNGEIQAVKNQKSRHESLFVDSKFSSANGYTNSKSNYERGNPTNSVLTVPTVNGYATANLTSPTTAGSDQVSAAISTLSDNETVAYIAGDAAMIVITPTASQLPADGVSSTPVTCLVTDAFGNHVASGIAVTVSATRGSMNPASGFTNANGVFMTNLLSARQLGISSITASAGTASGYAEVSFTTPQVSNVSLNTTTPSILADGISTATLTASVMDSYGLPISGMNVSWQTMSGIGHLIVQSNMTDDQGQATATYYSGASNSDASQNIIASANNHSSNVTMSMRGVSISSDVDDSSLPADGSSITYVNVHLRETMSGIAVINGNVRFACTNGSIPQSALTNSSGDARVSFMSGNQPGNVTINCIYGDTLRTTASLLQTSTEPQVLAMSIGAGELLANGVSTAPVQTVVYNESGQFVSNVPVTFTVTGSGYMTPAVVMSDDSGRANAVYHSAALPQNEVVSIGASIERADEERTLTLRGVSLQASSMDAALPANGMSSTQIRLELRESASQLGIMNVNVQFATNLGTIPAIATTDSSGVAMVTFSSGVESGMATIVARYGNLLTDTVNLNLYTPSASNVNLSASLNSVLANGVSNSNLTTLVSDQMGMPLSGMTVSWNLSGNGNLAWSTSVTNEAGIAMNTYTSTASYSDNNSTITATSGSSNNNMVIANRGVSLLISSVNSSLPSNGVSTTQIQAQLRETTNLVGIAGVNVSFGTSLGSIPSTALTDASGLAVVDLMAGQTPGNAAIVARYGNLLTDTTQVQMIAPSAAMVNVTAASTSLRADGMQNTMIQAQIYDAMGVAMPNTNVMWSSTYGSLSSNMSMTNSFGVATITYTAGASSVNRNVNVLAVAGTAQASTLIEERGVTINAASIPNNIIADGSSLSMIRVHVYETSSGVAISNATVSFGTSLGTIPNAGVTDSSGIASAMLTSATQTGVATINASFGNNLTATTQVTFAPSTPTTLSLTASPTILLADNVSTSLLTAVVTDQNGNPVPNGTQVRFYLPPQSGSLENLRTTQGGVATNILTSSSTPDTLNLIAWSELNPTARDSVTVIYRVGAPTHVTLSAQRDSLQANGIAIDTVTAHVTDAVGHALSNVEVQFSSTIGNITSSRVTDGSGNARVAFSSPQTGTAIITANASGALGTYTVYLIPGTPNSIQMEYFPGSVGVRGSGRNETLLISATVRDANNNPVIDGTQVYFNINNSPGGGDFLSSAGAIPTINGTASVSYNSGTVSGSCRIRAICQSISAVSTEILIYAGPPYIENIADACNTSHMSLGAFPCSMFGMDVVGDTITFTALVGDRYNNPVTPGTAVYFTTSAGVITTSTGYTDSAGFARVTLYGGSPLPTIGRWLNTLQDPNLGGAILCSAIPTQPGLVKVIASSAGVDANNDSVTVWASRDVVFDHNTPRLNLRSATVNGDPYESTLYIGESAVINIALYDENYWPMVYGSTISFSSTSGQVYPAQITVGCPGDTSYSVTFFNTLTVTDDDAATPVLITVDTRQGDAYTFTRTFTLRASLPS